MLVAGCAAPAGPGAGSAGTPAATLAPGPTATGSSPAGPSSAAPTEGCARPTPTGVIGLELGNRTVADTARLRSADGRLAVGERSGSAFRRPELVGPDGTATGDVELLRLAANLLSAARTVRVQLEPPAPPEEGLTAAQSPYDRGGRFVVYTTTRRVAAELAMTCGEQQQRWRLSAEADVAVGQVSCSGSSSEASRPAGTAAAEVYREKC